MNTTNPVAAICKAHGVPLNHGFCIADQVMHSRGGYWCEQARDWIYANKSQAQTDRFIDDLLDHCYRLIWQARHGATDVVISERDVSRIAQHVLTTMDLPREMKSEVEQYIHEGKVTMCGATVRVLQ